MSSDIQFICGKVEDALPKLAGGSFSLIFADPPYHRVLDEEWDRRHRTAADFLAWLGKIADEWQRVLAPAGSLYCWASPAMAAYVEVMLADRFQILNSITWAKAHAPLRRGDPRLTPYHAVDKSAARAFNSESERLIFAEHRGADSMALGESGYAAKCEELRGFVFEPLRAYLEGERKAAGVTRDEINEACGFATMAGHYFSRSQWQLPRPEHYAKMQALFNRQGEHKHLRREYEDLRRGHKHLRREYEDLRREYEDLRRPFDGAAVACWTDVWDYAAPLPETGRHAAEKPIEMCRDVLRASTRPGDLVLDCFTGSGSMAAACVDLGRRVVAIDESEEWIRAASNRADRHLSARTGEPHRVEMAPIRGPLFDPPGRSRS